MLPIRLAASPPPTSGVSLIAFLAALLLSASCGGDGGNNNDDDDASAELDQAPIDVATDSQTADTTEADHEEDSVTDESPDESGQDADVSDVPLLPEAVGCGQRGSAGGLGRANHASYLERHDIDLDVFPDALCNDGTGAFFYYRPYDGDENQNKWVIQLQGGGSCGNGQLCLQRWCSFDTNFGMQGMTATESPVEGINGKGILARRVDNPTGNYNQVFVRYCSSDGWGGTRRDVVTSAELPAAGTVEYRIHHLGAEIVDAVVGTLRRDGVDALTHTSGDAPVTLPDFDEAEFIVLSGASGGGTGVINNADHVRDLAIANNVNCEDPDSCPLKYFAIIDSIFQPDRSTLDYSTATLCTEEPFLCDYESHSRIVWEQGSSFYWGHRADASCVAWHEANGDDDTYLCSDLMHVLQHHITTPMFIRISQFDSLLTRSYGELRFSYEDEGVVNLETYGQLIRQQLAGLADIQTSAHEGSDMTVAPGVFSPTCPRHETLSDNDSVFDVEIEVGDTSYRMFEIIANWSAGADPSVAITPPDGREVCPEAD